MDISSKDQPTPNTASRSRSSASRPILNNSEPGQAVYEPFLGSGTTLVAAESSGRLCFAMEFEPRYVDVAVRRWQAFTGKQATRNRDDKPLTRFRTIHRTLEPMAGFERKVDSEHADIDAVLNMTPTDQETKIVPPAEEPEEMPLPSDPKVIFLGGLFILALLATAYVASEIVLPLVFAIILKLLLQPAMRLLERLHVPRILAALLLILALLGTIVGLGTAISGPAGTWAAKLPEGIPRLQERLSFMREPINTLQRFFQQVEHFGETGPSPDVASSARGPTLLTTLFTETRNFASGFFTTVLFLFFLLVSGDTFLHRLVEIMPRFSSKRQVVEISQQIESDISAYLVTITIMNAAVGIAMALAMWLTGVGDPILWGTVAFLLNYVPILGTALGALIFLLAGLLTIDALWLALLPAGLYLGFHLIEGETVTPMLLARRFTLNPVLVIISLVFWFWMWGIPGAILSVPMLAITKIICDRVRPLAAFGHFLER